MYKIILTLALVGFLVYLVYRTHRVDKELPSIEDVQTKEKEKTNG